MQKSIRQNAALNRLCCSVSVRHGLFLFVVTILSCSPLYALDPNRLLSQYLHQQWQVKEGLPQNTINTLIQSSDNFVWIGTHEGLVRFDGKKFRIYNTRNYPVMKTNRVSAIYESADKSIWFGTYGGGIYRLQHDVVQRIPVEHGFETQKIIGGQLFVDNAGVVWAVCHEGYLLYLDKDNFKVYRINNSPVLGFLLYKDNKLGMIAQRAGRVFRLRLNPGVQLNEIPRDTTMARSRFLSIAPSAAGSVYLVYNTHCTELQSGNKINFAYPYQHSNNFFIDSRKCVWYRIPRLYRYVEGRIDSLPQISSFSDRLIISMMEGREGEIWIGTDNSGLHKLSDSKFLSFSANEGLSGDIIWNVCEDLKQTIWCSSLQGYVAQINQLQVKNHFISNDIRRKGFASVYPLKDSSILTSFYGLYQIKNGQKKQLYSNTLNKYHDFQSFYQSPNGAIWLGSENQGLFLLEKNELKNIRMPDGMLSNFVSCITSDWSGNLLVGTQSGMYVLRDEKIIKRYTENEGLPNNWVRVLYVDDEDGSLWIGTDNGLSHFINGKFINYTTRNGLYSNVFHSILYRNGYFWYSCNLGIYSVEKRLFKLIDREMINSLTYELYDTDDGLISIEGNGSIQPAGWKTKDGKLLFAMSKGITILPAQSASINVTPPVSIVDLSENGRVIKPDQNGVIHLGQGTKNFKISFAVLSFTNPNSNKAKYMLEGFDNTWVNAEQEFEARYSALPAGTYVFKVVGANSYNKWNNEAAILKIVIEAPFYATTWFRGLSVILFISSLFFFIRLTERRKLARMMAGLENEKSLEMERARIARDMHDEIGANLTKISLLSGLIVPSENEKTNTILKNIGATLNDTILKMDEIVWAVNPSNDSLNRLITYIVEYADSFFESSTITCRYQIPGVLPEIKIASDKRHHLFLIVKEALNNAAKYSEATLIEITVILFEAGWSLQIKDNGKGFDFGKVLATANGLKNIQERALQAGATVVIDSSIGKGVQITLQMAYE